MTVELEAVDKSWKRNARFYKITDPTNPNGLMPDVLMLSRKTNSPQTIAGDYIFAHVESPEEIKIVHTTLDLDHGPKQTGSQTLVGEQINEANLTGTDGVRLIWRETTAED